MNEYSQGCLYMRSSFVTMCFRLEDKRRNMVEKGDDKGMCIGPGTTATCGKSVQESINVQELGGFLGDHLSTLCGRGGR